MSLSVIGFVLRFCLAALVFYTYYVVCLEVGKALQYGSYKSLFFIVMLMVGIWLFVFYRRSVRDQRKSGDNGPLKEDEQVDEYS